MYNPGRLPQTENLPLPPQPQGAEIPQPRTEHYSEFAAWRPDTPPEAVENMSAVQNPAEAASSQSFRERLGFVGEVAKRVGRAAVEGLISMDRSDREGTATDAHVPKTERVIDRAERSASLPAQGSEQERNDRAGMWARRIVKGAGYAITAAKIYRTYKKIKRGG